MSDRRTARAGGGPARAPLVAPGTINRPRRRGSAAFLLVVWAGLCLLASPLAAESSCITLADFSSDSPGSFPRGWRTRDEGYGVYRVVEEDGARFLRAVARGVGTQAVLERRWDLAEYPVLVW